MQRAPSTVQGYRIMVDRHFGPFFGAKALDRIGPDDVIGYIAAKRRAGLAPKTSIRHTRTGRRGRLGREARRGG
jgi:hypothetical protein